MSNKILVYGSLRKGQYNYERFGGEDIFKYHGTYRIPGYKLYSLGSYPGIKPNEEGSVEMDLLEVKDPETLHGINNMEIGAGYRCQNMTVDNKECTLYVYEGNIQPHKEVLSGDWNKR